MNEKSLRRKAALKRFAIIIFALAIPICIYIEYCVLRNMYWSLGTTVFSMSFTIQILLLFFTGIFCFMLTVLFIMAMIYVIDEMRVSLQDVNAELDAIEEAKISEEEKKKRAAEEREEMRREQERIQAEKDDPMSREYFFDKKNRRWN